MLLWLERGQKNYGQLEKQTNKKKRNEMPGKWWNQGQWNILFFSEQMFHFVGFSVGKQKLLTKSNSKPNMFLFFFQKNWTDKQTKKRNEMPTGRTKKTPQWWNQGQWNILFFSEQMFYFVGFSVGKINYSLKATQNLTCFFFCFKKIEQHMQTKKKKWIAHSKKKKNSITVKLRF